MMRLLVFITGVILAVAGNSQDHRIQLYDLGDGKVDQARDCLVENGNVFINSYYWNGQEGVSANLTLRSTWIVYF